MKAAARIPRFERVDNPSLYQRIVQQITSQIVSGILTPGASLPVEAELAQQFGVSRTVIREAVRVLVAKGLISVRQGSGMRVQPPESWNYLDPLVLFEQVRSGRGEALLGEVLEVRRIFEIEVAGLAAKRRTPEDLTAMQTSLAGMEEHLGDPDIFTDFDVEFHEHILAAARNRLLREAMRPVAETLQTGRSITNRLAKGTEASMTGHREIYDAIEMKDVAAARDAMGRHVAQFEQDIRVSLHTNALPR